MILDALMLFLTPLIAVAIGWSLRGGPGTIVALVLSVFLVGGLQLIADWLHRRLIRQWARSQTLAIISIKTPFSADFPGLPWWLGGSAYRVSARTTEGKEQEFAAWIYGVLFGLFRTAMKIDPVGPPPEAAEAIHAAR